MTSHNLNKTYFTSGLLVVVTGLGLYVILPQIDQFSASLPTLFNASGYWVSAAIAMSIVTVLCSAALYTVLAQHHLKPLDVLIVQTSGLFINRILPAGIGGIGLNYLFLRAHRHSSLQAATVVTANNLLGFIGHMALLLVLVGIFSVQAPSISDGGTIYFVIAGVLLVALIVPLVLHATQSKFLAQWRKRIAKQTFSITKVYRRHPLRLVLALIVSLGLTLSGALCLWLCCFAVGLEISFLATFMVFTVGVAFASVTPTPGGLGGAEAALVAGFVAQDIAAPSALACALLFRAVTYWLGLIMGSAACLLLKQRRLIAR